MTFRWDDKDPDEVLDYVIKWKSRLFDGDTIASSTFTITVGDGALTVDSDTFADFKTTVWLSGGTEAITYTVQNRVTTGAGRTMDQSIQLTVTSK